MALTPFRWTALFVIGALSVAILALSSSSPPPRRGDPVDRALSSRVETRAGRVSAITGMLRARQRADSVKAAASRRPPAPLRTFMDAAMPVALRPDLEALGPRALASIGVPPRVPLDLAFVYDTATRFKGELVYTYGMKPDLILPVKAGDHCVVILRVAKDKLPVQRSLLWRLSTPNRVLGLCSYYAAFGIPGPGIRSWLHDVGWSLSGDGSWTDAPSRYIPYYGPWGLGYNTFTMLMASSYGSSLMNDIPMTGLSCLHGELAACRRGAMAGGRFGQAWNGDLLAYAPVLRGYRYGSMDPRLGDRSSMLLASMVRSLGRENFERFWTSTDSMPGALKTVSGQEFGAWVHQWMVDQYGEAPVSGPSVSVWSLICASVLVALGLFVAVRVSSGRRYA